MVLGSRNAVTARCQVLLPVVRRVLELGLLDLELVVDEDGCGDATVP